MSCSRLRGEFGADLIRSTAQTFNIQCLHSRSRSLRFSHLEPIDAFLQGLPEHNASERYRSAAAARGDLGRVVCLFAHRDSGTGTDRYG